MAAWSRSKIPAGSQALPHEVQNTNQRKKQGNRVWDGSVSKLLPCLYEDLISTFRTHGKRAGSDNVLLLT